MIAGIAHALVFWQAASGALAPVEQDRLLLCMDEARTDPATAIVNASAWSDEAFAAEKSLPLQCLGFAYTSLLRWDAAAQAFTQARDSLLESDHAPRARLGAMAGNAALAGEDAELAARLLRTAQADAQRAGDPLTEGTIGADLSRALVALGRADEAAGVLADARAMAPGDPELWLLSATLSRRDGALAQAQSQIETAAALVAQGDAIGPEIGLEAGLIAALAGNGEAARASWQSVVELAPDSPQGKAARSYLAQLAQQTEGLPQ